MTQNTKNINYGNIDNKKKSVVERCLNCFIERGLFETTTRDLSKAINLQSGGIYQYFMTKDEIVIACAEEAALKLEEKLILNLINDIENPDLLMEHIHERADEMSATMKFFSQVCSSAKYYEAMRPVLGKLGKRYCEYAGKIADRIGCTTDDVAPFVYIAIATVTNYMIFGEADYIEPQIEVIKAQLKKLIEQRN